MSKYKLLLVTPDGEDYVTEGNDLTKDEAADLSEDMGSRWIFYGIHFIIKDNGPGIERSQRIIESPDMLEWTKNLSINTVLNELKKSPIDAL